MREIALHILDVSENGIAAGANRVTIIVDESRNENRLNVTIEDNGKGIPKEKLDKVADPFFTSRTTRRVGMGLSLLKAAAERCDGKFHIESEPGKGTRITATFQYDHIDRSPIGDMAGTMIALIAGNPDIDFIYTHLINGKEFILDTGEIRQELDGLSLSDAVVIVHLNQSIRKAIENLVEN